MTGPTGEQMAKLPALIATCRTSGDHETLAAAATDLLAEVQRLRAELADTDTAVGAVAAQMFTVKADRDALRGVAQALRITVEEMLSGKQHTSARTMVWQSTLKYATEALTAAPSTALQPDTSADLRVPPRQLKMLRETLCRTQSQLPDAHDKQRIQALIAEIDRHRPLGPDGTHSDRHTPTCGCENNTAADSHHRPDLNDDYQPPCGNPDCREWHCGNCEQHSGQFGHLVRGSWRCGDNSTGEQDGK